MGKVSDKAILDWLSKNHVSITYYESGTVEITWFIPDNKNPPCPSCKHVKSAGEYPAFRGSGLREATTDAMIYDALHASKEKPNAI